jgi:DNA-binding MarR family transcriptional regulator
LEDFLVKLDDLLVGVYHNLLSLEENVLKKGRLELSISEMHLIEQVGKASGEGLTIREIAERLGITSPSVTVAVQKLVRKEYVLKTACVHDGRAVKVHLTKKGKNVDAYHKYSRRVMTKTIAEGMTDSEKDVLLRAIQKLIDYFSDSIGEKA